MSEPIEVVLFDMGGVIVELGPLDELLGAEGTRADEFWPRWLASPAVRALESGRCSVERFAEDLVEELALDLSPAEVVDRFAAFPRGLYPGAVDMVTSLVDGIASGVLSNTNELHWNHQIDADTIQELFHHRYLSYRLGLTKPDRAMFDHVIEDLGRPARRILFIDDNRINVDGARAAGMRAELAKGPAAATAVLQRYDLVSSR